MKKTNKKGFTLIELLIVIVIIGILAVAVLSAINPIEQRNKGTDTVLRSDSAEFLNAVERYYASNGVYPWDALSSPVSLPAPGTEGTLVSTLTTVFDELEDSGELKPEFRRRDSLKMLRVWQDSASNLVRVCFTPKSNTFATAKDVSYYDNYGSLVTTTDCPASGPSASCQRCIPE